MSPPHAAPSPADMVMLAGIALAFSMGLLHVVRRETTSDLLFACFMFCWAFLIWASYLINSGAIYAYPHFYDVGYPFVLLWGPLLFLSLDSLLNEHFEMTWKKWLHLAPGLIALLTLIPLFTNYDRASKLELIAATIGSRRNNFYEVAVEVAGYHMIGYLLAAVYFILYTHRAAHVNYKGLLIAAAILGPSILLHVLGLRRPNWPGHMAFALTSLPVLLAMFVMAYTRSSVVQEVTESLRQQRFERSTRLQNVDLDSIDRRLSEVMQQKQPYLNSNLRISVLGRLLDLTGPQLSEFINRRYETNFNSYINRYRVDAAKKALVERPDVDITNVAYDCGFNSNSSFNAAFKKYAGTTPGKYRQSRKGRDSGLAPTGQDVAGGDVAAGSRVQDLQSPGVRSRREVRTAVGPE